MRYKEYKPRTTVTLSLNPEVAKSIKGYATEEDRSFNWYVNDILKAHVAEKEATRQSEEQTSEKAVA